MIAIDPALAKSGSAGGGLRPRELSRFLSRSKSAIGLRGQISVLLTGDERMRALNREFRHRNKATDVLSFPAGPGFGSRLAGDLAISLDRAARQAVENGHALQTEIEILILHGLLHLAGYDHEADAGEMARRERRLRKQLALPLGLIERGQTPRRRNSQPRPEPAPRQASNPRTRNPRTSDRRTGNPRTGNPRTRTLSRRAAAPEP